ncbi:MAG TPA: SAM hydroxide adenosyltransferase, partial [Candidatus Krumholzibacteria bacterium]|nr:SAM hydroxide adenosyltransferase [Candidatus Krumholzibacteria bacterium]
VVLLHDVPSVSVDGGVVSGHARYVDHFGNVLTDIPEEVIRRVLGDPARVSVRVAGRDIGPLRRTYADGAPGQVIALLNSWGLVEAAVNGGRAADHLNAEPPVPRFELRAGG